MNARQGIKHTDYSGGKAYRKGNIGYSGQRIESGEKGERGVEMTGVKYIPPTQIKVESKGLSNKTHHVHSQSMNMGKGQASNEDYLAEYPPDVLDISDEFENLKLLINEGAGVRPRVAQPGSRTSGVNRENKIHSNILHTISPATGTQGKRSITPNRQTRQGRASQMHSDSAANLRKKSLERGSGRGGGAKPGLTDQIRPGSRGKGRDVRDIVRAQVILHNQQL